MVKWKVTNRESGFTLGVFDAASDVDALEALARMGGYSDAIEAHATIYAGKLHCYATGDELRDATQGEHETSLRCAHFDGGPGVFMAPDGRRYYVSSPALGHGLRFERLEDDQRDGYSYGIGGAL